MKIIIYSPSYNPTSGGIVVLHKLCDILIELGYDAGFFVEDKNSFYVNSSYKSNHFNTSQISPENDLIIYPEIIWGNPLGFTKVVRYIMNIGHVTLGRKDTWGKNDFWLYYSERFYDKLQPKNILTISDSKLKYFKDYNIPRTYKECFTYRKKHDVINTLNIIHSPEAIEIGFNTTDEDLIKIFNVCERFYCYDTESHLSVLASLCGCDSIIVPNGTPREEIIDKSPNLKYGVAYGIEEIQQANKTRNKLRKFLENNEIQQIKNTKQVFTKILSKYA